MREISWLGAKKERAPFSLLEKFSVQLQLSRGYPFQILMGTRDWMLPHQQGKKMPFPRKMIWGWIEQVIIERRDQAHSSFLRQPV